MRESLFRGKRLDNGEWVYGYYVHIGPVSCQRTYIIPEYASALYVNEVYPSTVGQYTGLNDKHGKRIFEGDIAKVLQGKDKDIAYVGFENGAFMLYPKTGNIYERTLWEYWYNDWDVEVVGNITDNPELLEK